MTLKIITSLLLSFTLIQLSVSLEESTNIDQSENRIESDKCIDELPIEVCEDTVQNERCHTGNSDLWKCRQSCQLCNRNAELPPSPDDAERNNPFDPSSGATTCKDMLPFCDVVANPQVCCKFKHLANETCKKSCIFCYEMATVPIVSNVPGIPGMPGNQQGSPVINGDPCNPGSQPSVSGMPGTGGGSQPSMPGSGNQVPGAFGG